LAAIGTMAAGMAHEIKNPLASMKVLIQLLPQQIKDAAFQGKLHQILPREIERIDRIVEGLLSFARTTVSRKVPVDINKVIRECVMEYADQAQNAQVEISVQLGECPLLPGDTIQLQQVFANLIRNGIEAMPQGGAMKVQTSTKPGENGTSPLISISITDTGLGIPAGNLTKLFDPFFTTKHGGTGLGLAITHSIIQNHGGSIDVHSQPGEGTQFVIRIPLEREEKEV
jgi:signal transduction histidine kinase